MRALTKIYEGNGQQKPVGTINSPLLHPGHFKQPSAVSSLGLSNGPSPTLNTNAFGAPSAPTL